MSTLSQKQGYKYTAEFGYIPEDWDIVSLDDLVAKDGLIRGPFGGALKKEYFVNNGYKVYEQGNAIYGSIELGNYYIDNEKFKELKRFEVKEGDFIVSCSGTIGKIYRLPKGLPKGIINQALLKITINDNVISSDFFQIMFNWNKVQNSIIDSTQGGAMKNLVGMPIFKKTKMLKPQLIEQEKIAEVLGDIDGLIDKTQLLINKKKDLKTATMQKLLTPRDDWKYKKLEDCCILITKQTGFDYSSSIKPALKNEKIENTYPFIQNKDFAGCYINLDTDYYIPKEIAENFPKIIIDRPSILISISGKIGNVGYYDMATKSMIGGAVGICKLSDNVNGKFILYYLLSKVGQEMILGCVKASSHLNITVEDIRKLNIPFPDSRRQEQIATILSDMNAEIEALEKELSKYKDLKTGMMQQLLTGKIRLLDKVAQQERKVVSMEDVATHKVANDEFKDAILISALAHKFGSEKYPLGAFRRQKLSYFYKRHANMNIDEYTKKAMGPYNSKIKYHGAENIAIRNGYVKNVGGRGIVATNLISKAEEYYNRYYNSADMQWLDANFHYENNNNLEVLATIDYAINDLVSQNKAITLANIKTYIASDEKWKPKLDLDYFTDNNIVKAMEKIKRLFNSY